MWMDLLEHRIIWKNAYKANIKKKLDDHPNF